MNILKVGIIITAIILVMGTFYNVDNMRSKFPKLHQNESLGVK